MTRTTLVLLLSLPLACNAQYIFFGGDAETSLAKIKEMPGVAVELNTSDSAPQVFYKIHVDTDSPLVKSLMPNAYLVLVDYDGTELAQVPLNPFSGTYTSEEKPKPYYQIDFSIRKELQKNSYLIISHVSRRTMGQKVRLSEPEAKAPAKARSK